MGLSRVSLGAKHIEPVSDECNVQLPVESANPWIVHGVKLGYYRPATILKTLPGLSDLDDSHLQGKRIRQLNNGFFVLSDSGAPQLCFVLLSCGRRELRRRAPTNVSAPRHRSASDANTRSA